MKKKNNNISSIIDPSKNLVLYGYKKYFNSFVNLFEKKNLPNSIILSGPKGIGKATFVYHFINFILSSNESKKYDEINFRINETNPSYKLLTNNLHPNFFLLSNEDFSSDIKINQIRKLHKFLSTSTYSKDIKIILIDNAELLNKNSANSLLKSIEEPSSNTFFFIIQNNSAKILDTLKSRCVEFKILFSCEEKKNIFKDICSTLLLDDISEDFINNFLFIDSPGNVIKYVLELSKLQLSTNLDYVYHFLNKYKEDKNSETLSFLLLFINNYYKDLLINQNNKHNSYFINHSKVIRSIHDMKTFNLNPKNTLNSIQYILNNETK
jgi:DNA polymerase III subunit delta'